MEATAKASGSSGSAKMLRDFLSEVQTDITGWPTASVIMGVPGVGKTALAAAAKDVVFLVDSKELGIQTLKRSGQVPRDVPVLPPASNWLDFLECVRQVAKGDHPYKLLAVDTIGGAERLCHEYVCKTLYRGDWGDKGFGGYKRGYETSLPEWRLLIDAFDECRAAGIGILLLAHTSVKPHKNPLGEDFDRYVPSLHPKTWDLTHGWADMVLFANYHIEVDDSGGRAKGRGGQDRYLHTEYSAAFDAKNRHGLPPEIAMGRSGKEAWANLTKAMKEAAK